MTETAGVAIAAPVRADLAARQAMVFSSVETSCPSPAGRLPTSFKRERRDAMLGCASDANAATAPMSRSIVLEEIAAVSACFGVPQPNFRKKTSIRRASPRDGRTTEVGSCARLSRLAVIFACKSGQKLPTAKARVSHRSDLDWLLCEACEDSQSQAWEACVHGPAFSPPAPTDSWRIYLGTLGSHGLAKSGGYPRTAGRPRPWNVPPSWRAAVPQMRVSNTLDAFRKGKGGSRFPIEPVVDGLHSRGDQE